MFKQTQQNRRSLVEAHQVVGKQSQKDSPRADVSLRSTSPGWSLRSIVSVVYGYDFFVSYAHDDGTAYPRALVEALEAEPYNFTTHIDTRDYNPGDDLDRLTLLRVRNSRKLIVIAKRAALTTSDWVRKEVDIFARNGRLPLLIEFPECSENVVLDAPVPETSLLAWVDANPAVLRHPEQSAGSEPSEDTVRRIAASFEGMRVERRRSRIVGASLAGLGLLLLGMTGLALLADSQRREAVAQRTRVELELSSADARQALSYLGDGQDDAAMVFLSRALARQRSPLSHLTGHMTPEPRFAPIQRVRLPGITGLITEAWTDPTGRFVAVRDDVADTSVKVFDLDESEPRLVHQQDIPAFAPVFAIVSDPRPALLLGQSEEDALPPSEVTRLTARWLDDPDGKPAHAPVKVATGYDGFVRLADGRFYFSRGPVVSAATLDGKGLRVEEIDTGLTGYVNRITAAPGGSCFMLSNVSGTFVTQFIDGRKPIEWNALPHFEGVEAVNLHHLQGIVDASCKFAALWSDGGDASIHLFRLFDAAQQFAPQRIDTLLADPQDQITFRNRFFSDDGSQFVFRRHGSWEAVDTTTGGARQRFDAGQPESSGTISRHGYLLLSGYGDSVSYFPLTHPSGRSGKVSAGPTPIVLAVNPGRDTSDDGSAPLFMAVSADGLVTLFGDAGFKDRFEVFEMNDYIKDVAHSRKVFSRDGEVLIRILFLPTGERILEIHDVVQDKQEYAEFDCQGAVDFDLVESPKGYQVIGVTGNGVLCWGTLDRGGAAVSDIKSRELMLDEPLGFVRVGGNRIVVGSWTSPSLYDLTFENGVLGAPSRIDVRLSKLIVDVAVDGAGSIAALSQDAIFVERGGTGASFDLPSRCTRILGLLPDRLIVECSNGLVSVDAAGDSRSIALPRNVVADGAALSPDGSTLVAPIKDADNWARAIYARILATGATYVFRPAIHAELLEIERNFFMIDNFLPRIDRVLYSPGGNRVYLDIKRSMYESAFVSNGAIARFDVDSVTRLTGLSAPSAPESAVFDYRATRGP
ncbi:toll/interleukin-1 receptor domain-containing protein [Thiocapsa rosea]|uniref:TIR domain-containing protein n=1 Tax=Thiocapsa rosea TaxID=69360 RepID=A0A495VB57_9GAMM|nr:toll/interleukin-1 receptor domain-containing protein [Thiocapsa rosea]RKT46631.1 TIR domain-containing protein [Thiocapsa rosea]